MLRTNDNPVIRFNYYNTEIPVTCKAFAVLLPFTCSFFSVRVSGQEFWIDNAPELDIIQENASVFTVPGEVVYGPLNPKCAKTSYCMGIYYGEGRRSDSCKVFAWVFDEDMAALVQPGNDIWQNEKKELTFETCMF